MTEFKIGDRLRGRATGIGKDKEGVFTGDYVSGWPRIDNGFLLDPSFPITVVNAEPPKLSFVGPEPEPVEAPVVTTPFKVEPGFARVITDSRGNQVAYFEGSRTSSGEDKELATLVVKLLNAHFGAK